METEKKVIRYLIETKEKLTIRELSKRIKSDYKIVHTAVRRLIEKRLLKTERVGSSILIELNLQLTKEIFGVEFERREEILNNKNLKTMLDFIKENLNDESFILILFGSYAKRKANEKSDIDLMFIVPDLSVEGKIEQTMSLLPLKIHLLVFNEKQFRNMKDSKELNVVKEAILNNVILFGIERYYELIK